MGQVLHIMFQTGFRRVHACLHLTISHVWASEGEKSELPLFDVLAKCVAFGDIELHTGRCFSHLAHSLAGAEQRQLLDEIVAPYPE